MDTYEKKYKEALMRASNLYNDAIVMENNMTTKTCEIIFPELKESEDEKIVKAISYVLNNADYSLIDNTDFTVSEMEAWLEKQGDKPQGKSALEAINEEKVDNANKVEPKFKVGDCNGTVVSPCIPPCENNFHLWTIQDAKDGDVLHSSTYHLIWIYKDNEHFYACVNMNYVTENVATDGLIWIPNDACLATKEHREQLEKAMADAGYTFDFEKKELKKIEKPIEWSYEDEANLNNIIWLCNNCIKGSETTWIPSQATKIKHLIETIKEKGLAQQNPAWSEEDEKKRNLLIDILNVNHPNGVFKVNPINTSNMEAMSTKELVSWLKSLRPQSTWKPSDEQMEAFEHFVRSVGESGYASPYDNNTKLLYSILSDLKKLKEE